jgi:hypothetical protein
MATVLWKKLRLASGTEVHSSEHYVSAFRIAKPIILLVEKTGVRFFIIRLLTEVLTYWLDINFGDFG